MTDVAPNLTKTPDGVAPGRLVEAALGLAIVGWLAWLGLHPGPLVPRPRPRSVSEAPPPKAAAPRPLPELPAVPALPAWRWHRQPLLFVRLEAVCCPPAQPEPPVVEVADVGPGGLGVRVRAEQGQELQEVLRHEVWRRDADGGAWELVHTVAPGKPFEWVDRAGWRRRWEHKVVSHVRLDPEHPIVRRHPAPVEPRVFEALLPARRAEREVSVTPVLLHDAPGGRPRVDLRVTRWDPDARGFVARTFLAVAEGQPVGKPPRAGEGKVDFTTGAVLARIDPAADPPSVTLRWPDGWEETLPVPAKPPR